MKSEPDTRRWWKWFCGALVVGVLLNLLPLAETWDAWGHCGLVRVGFPAGFWTYGGLAQITAFYPELLGLDLVMMLMLSKFSADAFHIGFLAGIRRLRTWGTPPA